MKWGRTLTQLTTRNSGNHNVIIPIGSIVTMDEPDDQTRYMRIYWENKCIVLSEMWPHMVEYLTDNERKMARLLWE